MRVIFLKTQIFSDFNFFFLFPRQHNSNFFFSFKVNRRKFPSHTLCNVMEMQRMTNENTSLTLMRVIDVYRCLRTSRCGCWWNRRYSLNQRQQLLYQCLTTHLAVFIGDLRQKSRRENCVCCWMIFCVLFSPRI